MGVSLLMEIFNSKYTHLGVVMRGVTYTIAVILSIVLSAWWPVAFNRGFYNCTCLSNIRISPYLIKKINK